MSKSKVVVGALLTTIIAIYIASVQWFSMNIIPEITDRLKKYEGIVSYDSLENNKYLFNVKLKNPMIKYADISVKAETATFYHFPFVGITKFHSHNHHYEIKALDVKMHDNCEYSALHILPTKYLHDKHTVYSGNSECDIKNWDDAVILHSKEMMGKISAWVGGDNTANFIIKTEFKGWKFNDAWVEKNSKDPMFSTMAYMAIMLEEPLEYEVHYLIKSVSDMNVIIEKFTNFAAKLTSLNDFVKVISSDETLQKFVINDNVELNVDYKISSAAYKDGMRLNLKPENQVYSSALDMETNNNFDAATVERLTKSLVNSIDYKKDLPQFEEVKAREMYGAIFKQYLQSKFKTGIDTVFKSPMEFKINKLYFSNKDWGIDSNLESKDQKMSGKISLQNYKDLAKCISDNASYYMSFFLEGFEFSEEKKVKLHEALLKDLEYLANDASAKDNKDLNFALDIDKDQIKISGRPIAEILARDPKGTFMEALLPPALKPAVAVQKPVAVAKKN